MNKYSEGKHNFESLQDIMTYIWFNNQNINNNILGIQGNIGFQSFGYNSLTLWNCVTLSIMFVSFLWDNLSQLPWKPPSLCETSIWYSLYSVCSQHAVIIATWHPAWNNNWAGSLGNVLFLFMFPFFFGSSHVFQSCAVYRSLSSVFCLFKALSD